MNDHRNIVIDMSDVEMPTKVDTTPTVFIRRGPPAIEVDIVPCKDGIVDLAFECPWGCKTGYGRGRKPKRHLHGGGFVGGPISLGHRLSHCYQPGAPKEYVLIPKALPVGYRVDPEDPGYLDSGRPMNARILPVYEDRLQTLQAQVDSFRQRVDDAQVEYDRLLTESLWHSRTSSQVAAIHAAKERLDMTRQGLLNAERLLAIGLDIWPDSSEPVMPFRVCPGCQTSDALLNEDGIWDECGRSPPQRAL